MCPRCGQLGYGPYAWRRGNNEYLYFVHYEGGRKRECYLGAKERYIYFNVVEDMELRGLGDPWRYIDYIKNAFMGLVNEASKMAREGRVGEARRLIEVARRVIEEVELKLRNVEEALGA